MAIDVVSIRGSIGLDTSEWKRGVRDVGSDAQKLGQTISAGLDKAVAATQRLSPAQRQQEALTRATAAAQAQLNTLLSGGSNAAAQVAARFHALGQEEQNRLTVLREQIVAEKQRRAEMEKSARASAAGPTTARGGGGGGFLTAIVGGATGGLVALAAQQAGQYVKAFADAVVGGAGELQQAVANISSIKPTIDTSAVTQSLEDMSTRVAQSTKQLSDSLYNVFSSLDVTQEQGLQLTEKFARGAVGAMTDAQVWGTAMIGVLNAYGKGLKDADHIQDVFFNTINRGVVTGPELAASMGPATQAAKAAGLSIEEFGASITAVTKEGGPAAQNINNLSNTLQKIVTDKAQAGLKALKVETKDAAGNFLPFLDVIGQVKERMAGLTEVAKARVFQAIFPDQQARQGFQTLISQFDTAKKALKENQTAAGSAEAAYKKMSATWEAQAKLVKNAFNAVLTEIGTAILPKITPLAKLLAERLPQAVKTVKDAFQSLAPVVSAVFQTIAQVNERVLGPVADFIVAQWDKVKQWFQENLPLIKDAFQTVVRTIKEIWEKHGAQIMGIITPIWNAIKATISTTIRVVLGIIKTVLQVITGDWSGAWKSLKTTVQTAWDGVVSVVENLGTALLKAGELAISAIFDLGERIGMAIWNGITGGAKRQQEAAKKHLQDQVKATAAAAAPTPLIPPAMRGQLLAQYARVDERVAADAAARAKAAAPKPRPLGVAASNAVADRVAAAASEGGGGPKKSPAQQEAEQLAKQIAGNAAIRKALAAGESVEVARLAAQYTHLTAAQIRQAVADDTRTRALVDQKTATTDAWKEVGKLQAQIRGVRAASGKEETLLERYAKASPAAKAALSLYSGTLDAATEKQRMATEGQRKLNTEMHAAKLAYLAAIAPTDAERIAIEKFNKPWGELPKKVQDGIVAMVGWTEKTRIATAATETARAKFEAFVDLFKSGFDQIQQGQVDLAKQTTTDPLGKAVLGAFNMSVADLEKRAGPLAGVLEIVALSIAGVGKQSEAAAKAAELLADKYETAAESARAVWADEIVSEWEQAWGKADDAQRSAADHLEKTIARIRRGVEKQTSAMQEMIQGFAQGTQSVFQRAFTDLAEHGFGSFFKSVTQGFRQMLVQMAADYLASKVRNLVLKGIEALVGSAFGGGGGLDSSVDPTVPHARGGPVTAGRQYLVGERGPELFRAQQSGTIIPNQQLAAAAGGGRQFNITVHVQGEHLPAARKNASALATTIGREMDRQSRRNG